MPAELDPLSQLIGGLSAQISNVSTQIVELRSDVVTNRNASQTRNEELARKLDLVQAEYRNVKHLERDIAQEKVAIDDRLRKIDDRLADIDGRLGEIDKLILVWRTRLAMLLSFGAGLGALLGFLISAGVKWIFG